MEKLIEVKIIGMILDPVSKSPVIILKPNIDKKIIPIWVGGMEANAITLELENVTPPRPMTHDLIKSILKNLNISVEKIVITDVVENTYYAELFLNKGRESVVIDCRPSDAIAIALKNRSKIYITDQVFQKSIMSDVFSNIACNSEKLESWFNSLSIEDFGTIEQ